MPSLTTTPALSSTPYRITSIDLLRGIVMIVMAIDHTRDIYHIPAVQGVDPLAPLTTTPAIFFTRWITHYCAPTFVFLSGLSAYLSSQKKNSAEASLFLINRGIWLIFVEMVIITFGLTFDFKFRTIIWQVIWAIGCSMIILGVVRQLHVRWVLIIGCILFFGHDLFIYVNVPQTGTIADLIRMLFTTSGNFIPVNATHNIGDFYAILPWTGVMLIGYSIGPWFSKEYAPAKRKRNLLIAGLSFIALFIILRFIDDYGNPFHRQPANGWRSILAFLNVNKYPPSLMFCCMTLGPSMVFLALSENIKSGWSRIASVYGKVPFFYYVLHFYILHTLLIIFYFATGHGGTEKEIYQTFIGFQAADFGYPLWIVYIIWFSVVASLYFPCRWFYKYKMSHGQWWLKYL